MLFVCPFSGDLSSDSRLRGLSSCFTDFRRGAADEMLLLLMAGPSAAHVPRSIHLKSTWPVGQHFDVDVSVRINGSPLASSRHDSRMTARSRFPSLRNVIVSTKRSKVTKNGRGLRLGTNVMRLPGGHSTRSSKVSQQTMEVHLGYPKDRPSTSQYPCALTSESAASKKATS